MALNNLGSIASIIGLVVSICGFIFTLYNVTKSRKAAEAANTATESLRSDLRRTNTVADVSTVIAFMEEIKRLHRSQTFEILPDRYASLRRLLISIRAENPILGDVDMAAIQGAISQLSSLERAVEKHLAGGEGSEINVPKTNNAVSKVVDNLGDVVNRIKADVGQNQ